MDLTDVSLRKRELYYSRRPKTSLWEQVCEEMKENLDR
jgi:hypothetical protein